MLIQERVMTESANKMEKETIDPELFEMLDKGLRESFQNNCKNDNISYLYPNKSHPFGIAAARSAQALIGNKVMFFEDVIDRGF